MKFLIATLTVFLLLSSKTLAQDTEPTIPTFSSTVSVTLSTTVSVTVSTLSTTVSVTLLAILNNYASKFF